MMILKRMKGWLGRRLQVICALAALASAAEATWSIVVVDTATGEVCVATATCLAGLNIANYVPVIVVGEGAAAAQNYVDQSGQNRILIRDALLAGLDPSVILSNLAASDAQHNSRQYGIVSLNGGPPIAYTGTGGGGAKKQVYGEVGTLRYSIQGNVLAGQVVVDAAEAALLETEGDLVTRAMASMQAARSMGGDGRCSCSTLIPTSCGAPPPSFEHSSFTACIIIARDGDVDGSCRGSGCANGSYFLRKTVVGNAGLPDPVETLDRQVMQWRISKRGRPDHIQTEVLPSATHLPADGLSTSEVTIRLRDIDGVPMTDGGQTFILDDITPGGPIVSLTNQVDHGDGTHTLSFTSGTTPGTARIKISVVHWWEESQLYPYLELTLDSPSPLHLGNEVLSAVDGGEAPLTLNLGAQGAGRPYLLLVSGSGTQPGTPFGGLTLPLNSDRLLDWSLGAPSPGFWPNMNGNLDANGRRLSALSIAPGALAPFVGSRLDFCALLSGYVTGPVGVDVSP